jgi:membrane associated rhomboid family serine protease
MGFQDRGYYRERYTPSFAPEWTAVMTIIIVNIGLWVANLVAAGEIPITAFLALKGNLFERPWDLWQLVTYGFVHDPTSPMHVFVNMLALFFFGREVEAVLGRERFVRFYLIAIVIANLT